MLAADDVYMDITTDITAFITVQAYPNTTKLDESYQLDAQFYLLS
jgi:hypothetical protein